MSIAASTRAQKKEKRAELGEKSHKCVNNARKLRRERGFGKIFGTFFSPIKREREREKERENRAIEREREREEERERERERKKSRE